MADYAPPRRLSAPTGVTTGSRLSAPKVDIPRSNPASTRPAPAKKRIDVKRLADLALTGETAYNWINNLSGDRIGEYDNANKYAKFAADTFLSPVGLAATVAAPVTGGASLGLKAGLAANAARGATRLGAELAVNAAAAGGAKVIEAALPEDSPGWARAAAMMVGAVAGGGAAGRAVSRATGVAAAQRAIEVGYEIDRAVQASSGMRHIPVMPSFDSGVAEMQARQIGTKGPVNAAKRAVNETLGISPFSNRSTPIGAIQDFEKKRSLVDAEIPQQVMAKLFPGGKQNAFVTHGKRGELWQLQDGSIVPMARILATPAEKLAKYNLTPEQRSVWQVGREVIDDGSVLLRSKGIKLPDIDLGPDTDYFPNYSVANLNGDFRRAADRGKTRQYKKIEDGLEKGVEYAGFEETLTAYLNNVLTEARLKDMDDAVRNRAGVTIDQALIDTKPGRFQSLRVDAAGRKVDALKAKVEQAMTRNKYAKGQASSELRRLQLEIRDLAQHERNLAAAIKTAASAEIKAPRRPATAARREELATGRAEFAAERRAITDTPMGGEPTDLIKAADEYRAMVRAGRMTEEQAAALMTKRATYSEELRSGVDSTDALRAALEARKAERATLSEAAKAARVKGGDVPALESQLVKAREKLELEKSKWTDMRQHVWDRLPGGMFGRGEEEIPVALWNNKYYVPKDADYADFAQHFDTLTGNAQTRAMPRALKTAEDVVNLARFTAATADVAGAFTTGLALLAHSPKRWAYMAGMTFKAIADPAVQGRYIQKNLESMKSMIVDGRVPGGEIEVFKAVEKDGLARFLKGEGDSLVAQGARKTGLASGLTRFQRSYDTMLMITRHQLWDALLPVWKGERSELGDYIKKATGGLDPRGLGVGPNRQAVESMTFFAPRMLRSTLALTADAMKPWTQEGQVAAQTLMRLSAGMAGVMMLANIAVGGLNGESEEEIERRLDGAINPLDGRKFLSIPIGDHYYGVGGQVRGITQLLTKAAVNPKSLTEQDALDNPLIRFAEGRLSPGANAALGVAELMTDEEHNFLPFNTVDSFPDLVKMSASSALPFALQGAAEEGFDWSNPATYASPFVTAATEVGGLRASMFTPKDVLDKSSYERFGLAFDDLTDSEQKIVEDMNPDIQEARNKLGDKKSKLYREAKDELDGTARSSLSILQEQLTSGEMAPREYRMARAQVLRDRSVALDQAQADYDIEFGGVDSDKRRLLNDFFNTYEESEILPGQLDWDLLDEKQAALQKKVSGGAYGNAKRAQQILDERLGFEAEPDDWFEENARIIKEYDYWGVKEDVWPKVAAAAQRIDPNISSIADLEQAILIANKEDPKLGARLGAVYQILEKFTGAQRQILRKQNPKLDRALLENGYTTKVLSKAAMAS